MASNKTTGDVWFILHRHYNTSSLEVRADSSVPQPPIMPEGKHYVAVRNHRNAVTIYYKGSILRSPDAALLHVAEDLGLYTPEATPSLMVKK